jgi:hypothetical protein
VTTPAPVSDASARRFLVRGEDTIDRYPRRQDDRRMLLRWIAERTFTTDDEYTESEVNGMLSRYSDDVAVLRRHLVDVGLLERFPDGTGYRRARPLE